MSKLPRDQHGEIDWGAVKQRLAQVQQLAAATEQLSPEQGKAEMDRRAKLFACVPPAAPDTREILEVMTFRWGEQRLAIESRWVREVVLPGELTPVPGTPPFLEGVMNLRGDVLAVMELRGFFGVVAAEKGEHTRTLILGGQRVEFGVIADLVEEVTTLRIADVLAPPGSMAAAARDFLRGVTAAAVLVIDGAALLRDTRLTIEMKD